MKTSIRYTLIAVGILVFFVVAPALVLYVSGRTINLDSKDTNATGILDAKTNPSGTKLLIDDKDYGSTPAIARFLKQGDYNVTLTKDGYFNWTKRLPIIAGEVTYAQEGVTEVQMIKQSSPVSVVTGGVSSFLLVNDTLWYITGNSVVIAPLSNPDNKTITNLSFKPQGMFLLRDKHHVYLGNHSVINLDDKSVVTIPMKAGLVINPNNLVISSDGIFIYSDGTSLFAYNSTTEKTSTLLENVSAITYINNTGYILQQTDSGDAILSGTWNGTTFVDWHPLINPTTELYKVKSSSLFITDSKELFCACGGVYRVGEKLEKLSAGVKSAFLDLDTNEFSFLTDGDELYFYNFLASKPQLVTRGNLGSNTAFMVRSSLGYSFVGNTFGLNLIELDNRDYQNHYQLISGKQVWQVALSNNQKTAVVLQDGSLIKVDFRN